MTTRVRLEMALDRCIAIGLATLLVGMPLAFGGAAWWAPAALAVMTSLIVLLWLLRATISGKWRMLKSPLSALGVLAIGLGVLQSLPISSNFAEIISPKSHQIKSLGALPDLVQLDDPELRLPEPTSQKSPMTLDRPATLRWVAGATACLGLFWVVSHFTDRLNRLYLIWGCVVAAFLINASIVVVQIAGQAEGLYGFIQPGQGPKWAPNIGDAINSPGETALRVVDEAQSTTHKWALNRPSPFHSIGTMMGGPDAFLALASLGLPLALAITLQLMAPRGSREGLWSRLAQSGQGSLLVLLYLMTIVSAGIVGLLAGPIIAIPFATAIILVGLPSLVGTGLRCKGLFLTLLSFSMLTGGVLLGEHWNEFFPMAEPLHRSDFARSRDVWSDSIPILKDFPIAGVGLGGFATILPYYKTRDSASTTAMSSLLQWGIEAGLIGLAILGLAAIWGLYRLPAALLRVGSADRALACGMIGVVACFGLFSIIHWTVELMAVSLAAVGVAATCHRWLAGGTDLFVERG